jgi:3'-5' exoribonuclease
MVKWEAQEGIKKEDREYSRELLHIIYSHHGQLEWGALVKPATVEAQLVHQLDYMDSKMMHIHDLIGQGQGDLVGLTKKSFTLGNSFLLQKLKE